MTQTVNATVEQRKLLKQFTGKYCPAVIGWNYLMPVLDKIGDKCFGFLKVEGSNLCEVTISNNNHYIGKETIKTKADAKIEAVWQAVIQFILWYTTQSTKQ